MELIRKSFVPLAYWGAPLAVATASGKIIGPHGPHELDPARSLDEFNRLPEAERKPAEPAPLRGGFRAPTPPGLLIARVWTRALTPAPGGCKRDEYHSRRYAGPQLDYLWLTEAEWRSLVPASPVKGGFALLPAPIAHRIVAHYFFDSSHATYQDGNLKSWKPEQVKGELRLEVDKVTDDGVFMRLVGSVQLQGDQGRRGKFDILGYWNYHRKKDRFDRFDIVALGEYQHPSVVVSHEKEMERMLRENHPVGLHFEVVAPGSPGYGIAPRRLWLYAGGPWEDEDVLAYFGKNLSEVDEGMKTFVRQTRR